jgi:hypothetical protein
MTLRLWILRSLSLLASLLLVLVYHDILPSFSLSISAFCGGLSGIHASGAAFDGFVLFHLSSRVSSINQSILSTVQINSFSHKKQTKSQFDCDIQM